MQQIPSQEEISRLASFRGTSCVSIYVPYMAANAATNPARIELKDLIKEAEAGLRAVDVSEELIGQTLSPAHQLLQAPTEFWPHWHQSLVLFLHPRLHRIYRVPVDVVVSRMRISRQFTVQPLLNILHTNGRYAVLVLDHHATQLYVGDRYSCKPARIKGFPADVEQTLRIDEFPSWRQLHGIGPSYLGKQSEGYHSQYNVSDVDKQMLLEFFRVVDRRLHRYLEKYQLPVVLAGVSYLLPLYRKVNTYRKLLPNELHGSFRRMASNTLRDRVWASLQTV